MADFFPNVLVFTAYILCSASAATDPGDLSILRDFHDALANPDLLKWPPNDADPCGNSWNYIFCTGDRVTQIEVQKLGLRGNLTRNLNGLTQLTHLGLQKNEFAGPLPSLAGLSSLQYAYFDYNRFDSIPGDFFVGLDSLRIMALDGTV
ncbi:hypothetical protein MLD38_017608 [Melastoma candidum]|uniref:Uncharacterized protein n=1 Tax=Melastoma candidum TaxID=119954 RepID=A0ACB9QV83_9MYRT|nr:hypothetical protein MLD38_017608 [Melastoma candidum]